MPLPLRVAHVVLVEEHERVAHPQVVLHGQLLRESHRVVIEGHGRAGEALAEAHGAGHLIYRARDDDVHAHGLVAALIRGLHVLDVDAHDACDLARRLEVVGHVADVQLVGVVVEAHRGVKVDDGSVLAVDDVPNGVV